VDAKQRAALLREAYQALLQIGEPGLGAQLDAKLAQNADDLATKWQRRRDALAAELVQVDQIIASLQQLAASGGG
jgi:hypothetical protein